MVILAAPSCLLLLNDCFQYGLVISSVCDEERQGAFSKQEEPDVLSDFSDDVGYGLLLPSPAPLWRHLACRGANPTVLGLSTLMLLYQGIPIPLVYLRY